MGLPKITITNKMTTTTVSDSDKWILTYFQLYGRGEACRMALEHGKVNWEDNAVTGEAWTAFKASGKCANGQLPVLEVDGKYLNQSEAIIRFMVARLVRILRKIRSLVILRIASLIPLRILNNVLRNKITANL